MDINIKISDYINIYIWRFFSLCTGFLSLLIVVPLLSSNIELFGLYSFCTGFVLYLTYADIGFLSASSKFAAEEYAKNNLDEEYKIFGFTFFLLILMFFPFSLLMIFFSFNPEALIDSTDQSILQISSYLFLVIGLLVPFQVFLQRLVGLILTIRLKDYIFYRIEILANLVKIFSVYFFFTESSYLIAEYFLFITIISILSALMSIWLLKKEINYSFYKFFSSLSLSKKYFNKTKKLAFSSLAVTIGFIIYYEIDLLIIGKFIGLKEVGIYAIAFTILNFLRNIVNIFYSPFAQRFNHFVGQQQERKLIEMFNKLFDYTIPLFILSHLVLFLCIDEMILLWVGAEFKESILISKILIICSLVGVVTQPANHYFFAKLHYKYLYTLAFFLPFSFLTTIYYLLPTLGILSIAYAKLLASVLGFMICLIGVTKVTDVIKLSIEWLPRITVLILLILIATPFLEQLFLYDSKNSLALVSLSSILSLLIIISYFLALILKENNRKEVLFIIKRVKRYFIDR